MSEPLSSKALEAEREVLRHAVAAPGDPPVVARLIRYAHAERDRVAELEKDKNVLLLEQEAAWPEYVARAHRAEAGLAAAQKALKWYAWQYGKPDRLIADGGKRARDALARGGGQQEIG